MLEFGLQALQINTVCTGCELTVEKHWQSVKTITKSIFFQAIQERTSGIMRAATASRDSSKNTIR